MIGGRFREIYVWPLSVGLGFRGQGCLIGGLVKTLVRHPLACGAVVSLGGVGWLFGCGAVVAHMTNEQMAAAADIFASTIGEAPA
jgi:hypothetical protein